jgi:hypothetical protein
LSSSVRRAARPRPDARVKGFGGADEEAGDAAKDAGDEIEKGVEDVDGR